MAETPETSDHTSIKKRIQHVLNIEQSDYQKLQSEGLYPFVGNPRIDMPDGLPFELEEYVELVDLTDRQIREGKKVGMLLCSCNRDISASLHVIDATELPILQRLDMENDNWKDLTEHFEKKSKGSFHGCVALPRNIACHLYTQKRLCFQIRNSL